MKGSAKLSRQVGRRVLDAVKVASVASLVTVGACYDGDIQGPNWGWGGGVGQARNTDHAAEADFRRELGATGALFLSGVVGSVDIAGSTGAQGIVVEAVRRVRSDSPEDARAHLDELAVDVRESGGAAIVETRQPALSRGRKYEVEYRVQVPAGTDVTVVHVAGPVEIRWVAGDVDIDAVAGPVRLVDLAGDVRGAVASGSVDASVTLPPSGRVELHTGAGSIALSVPTGTSASLLAAAAAGTIRTVDLSLVDQDPRASVLRATMGGGDGTIRLETGAGDITIKGR